MGLIEPIGPIGQRADASSESLSIDPIGPISPGSYPCVAVRPSLSLCAFAWDMSFFRPSSGVIGDESRPAPTIFREA
jgi:hypothetical protein